MLRCHVSCVMVHQEGPPSVPVLAIEPPSPPLPVPAPPGAPAPGVNAEPAAPFAYTPQQYAPIVAAAISAAMQDGCGCAMTPAPTQVSIYILCVGAYVRALSRSGQGCRWIRAHLPIVVI